MVKVTSRKPRPRLFGYATRYAWLVIASLNCIMVMYLNYNARAMRTLLEYYADQRAVILSGLAAEAARLGAPTFPMWGYSWLTMISTEQLVLCPIQLVLALYSSFSLVRHIEVNSLIPEKYFPLLQWILALAVPWYAFHAVRWPNSLSVSLIALSFVFLHRAFLDKKGGFGNVVVSGLSFGMALNFRSDYYLFPAAVAVCWVCFSNDKVWGAKKCTAWLSCIYGALLPWVVYTAVVSGSPSLTSTNSGHVLFISLGNYEHNVWGITPTDGDPVMRTLVEDEFGPQKSTLTGDADRFLKNEFLKRIASAPFEYCRKCKQNLYLMIVSGCYGGEFLGTSSELPFGEPTLKSEIDDIVNTSERPDFMRIFRVFVSLVSKYIGIFTVFLSFAFLPLTLTYALRTRHFFWMIIILAIVYQCALQTFAFHSTIYTGNSFLFHIANISLGTAIASCATRSRLGQ